MAITSIPRSRPPLESKSTALPRASATPAATQKVTKVPGGCWQKIQRYAQSTFPFFLSAFNSVHAWFYPPPKEVGPIDWMAEHLQDPKLTAEVAKQCYLDITEGYLGNRENLDKSPTEVLENFWDHLIRVQEKAKMPPLARAVHSLNRLLMDDISPQDAKAKSVGMVADIKRIKNIKDDPLYALFQEKAAAVDKKAKSPAPRPTPIPLTATVQPVIGINSGSPNNCFINATLQRLYHNPHIRAWILGDQFPKEFGGIRELFEKMEEDRLARRRTCRMASAAVRQVLHQRFPNDFSKSDQEDANVFFTHIMGLLQRCTVISPPGQPIVRRFTYFDSPLVTEKKVFRFFSWGEKDVPPLQGSVDDHRMTEVNPGKREGIAFSPTEKGSNEISFTLPDDLDPKKPHGGWKDAENGAQLILDAFAYKQKVTQGYQTSKGAKTFVQHAAEVHFSSPPLYLFVRADRFNPDGRTKRNMLVNMPLSPITIPGKHFSFSLDPRNHPANQRYELCEMIRHTSGSGSARSGHYLSYVKKDGQWYELNDGIPRLIIDPKEVSRLASDAYLYQFRRVD